MAVDFIYSNTNSKDKNERISNIGFLEVGSRGVAVITVYLLIGTNLFKQEYLMTSESN